MSGSPVVSIIVPVYNVKYYLDTCVQSVLKQTYGAWELILVDDGSTDGSSAICDQYANDDRVKVIHKQNGGQSSARNVGIDAAKGKYIYFLDSDDYIDSNTLQVIVEKAESEESEVVFFDGMSFYDGMTGRSDENNLKRFHQYSTDTGIEVFAGLVSNKEYHCALWLLLIKADLLKKIGLRFEEGIIYEDEIFTYKLFCMANKVSYVNRQLYWYRIRPQSTVTKKKSKFNYASICTVYANMRDFQFEKRVEYNDTVNRHIARFASNTINVYRKLSRNEKRELRGQFEATISDIKANEYYNDAALKMKCHSELLWVVYKIWRRIF